MLSYIVNVFDEAGLHIVKSFETMTADKAHAIENKYLAEGRETQLLPNVQGYLDKYLPPTPIRRRKVNLPEYLQKLL